ncbi:hypothetical protein [Paractinoplanes ferrugineus]|nr:hypothetical protein [Actinoplanes ferrugineus]
MFDCSRPANTIGVSTLAFALDCLVDAMRDESWQLGRRLRERVG